MLRRGTISVTLGCLLAVAMGCTNVFESYAAVTPDEVLFGRAMKALDNDRRQEAKTLLETLVATYPDSAYALRANLALDDIWYAEGGIGPRLEMDRGLGEKMTFFPPLKESSDKQ